ncbi:MAG TPA: hypothetical protein VN704_12715 [Verrucomicrobiae bacterium]|nr:hypothetical protein [Verrucomicrobiae bacterium]
MSKLNLIAIVAIVAAVSLIVGMAAPVFAQGNSTNSTMGNMPGMNMTGNSTGASTATGTASAPAGNSTK